MKKTRFVNTLYMHPQERNIHGKIFGGYLMKEAFELAWIGMLLVIFMNFIISSLYIFDHDFFFELAWIGIRIRMCIRTVKVDTRC
jgi:hypothetical protein